MSFQASDPRVDPPGEVLARYFTFTALGPIAGWQPVTGSGFSGSRLWRVTAASGRAYCLRRWPREHPSVERLQLIHTVLRRVGGELPAVAVPLAGSSGATWVEAAGYLWELTEWKPGAPDSALPAPPGRLAAALGLLARFHTLADWPAQQGIPPAVVERQRLLAGLQGGRLETITAALAHPIDPQLDALAGELLALARSALARPALRELAQTRDAWPLAPAIRDVHREHVLFTGDAVTGLIDFGALRIDTPLTDVARLVGSLAGDDAASREAALEAYAEVRPLGARDRERIGLLDETGLILAAFHWLAWLYVERRDMGPVERVARRLEEIARRLVGTR